MMRKTVTILILILFIHTVSFSQNISDLSGKWISENDKLNVIEFKGNKIYEYYDNELEEISSFFLSNNCKIRSKFLDQNKSIFLNQISHDNSLICSEVSSFTKNRLTLMYSENGKISIFIKQKIIKPKK